MYLSKLWCGLVCVTDIYLLFTLIIKSFLTINYEWPPKIIKLSQQMVFCGLFESSLLVSYTTFSNNDLLTLHFLNIGTAF